MTISIAAGCAVAMAGLMLLIARTLRKRRFRARASKLPAAFSVSKGELRRLHSGELIEEAGEEAWEA